MITRPSAATMNRIHGTLSAPVEYSELILCIFNYRSLRGWGPAYRTVSKGIMPDLISVEYKKLSQACQVNPVVVKLAAAFVERLNHRLHPETAG